MSGDYTKETRAGPEVQLPLEMHFRLERPHQNSPPSARFPSRFFVLATIASLTVHLAGFHPSQLRFPFPQPNQ